MADLWWTWAATVLVQWLCGRAVGLQHEGSRVSPRGPCRHLLAGLTDSGQACGAADERV